MVFAISTSLKAISGFRIAPHEKDAIPKMVRYHFNEPLLLALEQNVLADVLVEADLFKVSIYIEKALSGG